jgi:hypothetical protein
MELRIVQMPRQSKASLRKTLKLLEDAKSRIEDKKNWCQGQLIDEDGRMCALGAIWGTKETFVDHTSYASTRLLMAVERLYPGTYMGVSDVNDEKGHSAVMRMYDSAIRSVKSSIAQAGRRR